MWWCIAPVVYLSARPLVLSKTYTIEARTVTLAAHFETNLSLLNICNQAKENEKKNNLSTPPIILFVPRGKLLLWYQNLSQVLEIYLHISLSFLPLVSRLPILSLSLCIFLCPLSCRCYGCHLVFFPALSNIGGKGVIGVGSTEEGLDGEQNRSDLQRRRPVVCDEV